MIKFSNFNFKYENSNNLNLANINFEIKKGECILLTGNSGCGKTTILRILNGLAPSFFYGGYSGDVKVAHLRVGDSLSDFSMLVGSVFQNPKNQFFHLDSTSELAFSMENYGVDTDIILDRIDFISEKFSAKHLLDRNILELSGGEKQKLSFMASMMLDADIYVLDEITSNLDLKSINLIADIIKTLKQSGKTIIIAEHRIYYLRDIIDRMFIIRDGTIFHEFNQKDLMLFDGVSCRTRQLDLKKVSVRDKKLVKGKENYLSFKNFEYKVNNYFVKHISENFSTGKIYAIVGENGCGKTTFANTLSGFNKHKGDVFLNGKKLRKKDLIANSFLVMQDVNYQLFTNSVEREIKLGAKSPNNFSEIITKLKLDNLLERHPNTLSGGEKQRVAIASALLSGKNILIFDEPTSGLDYNNMYEFATLLEKLRDYDLIIFIITHDYEFLCTVADEVLHFTNKKLARRLSVTEENKEEILNIMV